MNNDKIKKRDKMGRNKVSRSEQGDADRKSALAVSQAVYRCAAPFCSSYLKVYATGSVLERARGIAAVVPRPELIKAQQRRWRCGCGIGSINGRSNGSRTGSSRHQEQHAPQHGELRLFKNSSEWRRALWAGAQFSSEANVINGSVVDPCSKETSSIVHHKSSLEPPSQSSPVRVAP